MNLSCPKNFHILIFIRSCSNYFYIQIIHLCHREFMKRYLLLLLFLTTGCSTQLKYEMNNVKFLSPETKGKFLKGDIGIGLQQTHKVILTEAFDAVIFNTNDTTTVNSVENGSELSIPINLGLLERLDAYTLDSKYGLKFQFLGDSEFKRTEGYKASVAIAIGHDTPESENVVYRENAVSRTYSTAAEVDSLEFSLIAGKRFNSSNMLYLNLFHDQYNYEGNLTSNQFAPINAKGKSTNSGVLLGYQVSGSGKESLFVIWKVEGGVVRGKLGDFSDKTSGVYGTTISLGW